jgi:hypothetical protein
VRIPEKERADVGIGVSLGGNGENVGNGVAVNGNDQLKSLSAVALVPAENHYKKATLL